MFIVSFISTRKSMKNSTFCSASSSVFFGLFDDSQNALFGLWDLIWADVYCVSHVRLLLILEATEWIAPWNHQLSSPPHLSDWPSGTKTRSIFLSIWMEKHENPFPNTGCWGSILIVFTLTQDQSFLWIFPNPFIVDQLPIPRDVCMSVFSYTSI